MDEYKQYYYSARPSAQGKAFGRFVALLSRRSAQTGQLGPDSYNAANPNILMCFVLQHCRPRGAAEEAELQTFPLVHGERLS